MSKENTIIIDQKEDFYILIINRPEALNALNKHVFDELENFFSSKKNDYSVKGVVITGSGGKAFAAGADIKEFAELTEEAGTSLSKRGHDILGLIESFHAPVIAAVNGFALGGGCELSMACHIRVAGKNAKFGQPEVNLGLVTGYAGSQRLVQLIGKGKALEMLLTSDIINAEEALNLGLVTHVVEAGDEVNKSLEILEKIAKKGPLAVAGTIELVNAYFDNNIDGNLLENKMFGRLLNTLDAKEGALAFIEKRSANFKAK